MAESRKSKLFKTYLSRMETLKKDKYAAELFAGLESGKNSYMRIDRLESSNFDMTWINRIEDCIYELGEIIANPKEVTKTVTSIVPVELARKTGADSVQHLASHTQYIKEITDKGDVVPNKILNIGSEEDIHTYENRFIATLVRRLVLFIEKRYEFVRKFSKLHDEEILYYKTKAIVDGSEVEIETKVKVRSESDSEAANLSNSYVSRIVKLREYVMYFYGSKFMKELKTERDVRNPIVMTNILRKNPKYHKCYELFRFIEKYDKLGVAYKLDEDASMFSDEELRELNTVMLTNYLALKARDRSKVTKGFSRTYKPRILTSIDDEQFVYGDLLRGPFEFIRVDEEYQKYLDEQLRQDLPPRPTKVEKEYYEEEIAAKNTRKVERAAIDKLAKRKKKEQADYEKQVKAIIAQREKEEQERQAREAEAARKEQERKIEEVRQALIRDAMFGSDNNPESEEGNSHVLNIEEEAPVQEELPIEETIPEEEVVPEVEEEPVQEEEVVEEPQEELPEEEQASEEEPQEEIQEEVAEEPVSEPEEAPEEAVEEPQIEEEIPEEVVEESEPQEEEETAPIEESAPEEEVVPVEEAEEEEVSSEEPAEEDIDAVRRQLMEDALSDEEPQEEETETPVEEPVVEEEQPEEVIEEAPVEEPVIEAKEMPEEEAEEPQPEEEPAHVEEPDQEEEVSEPEEEPTEEVEETPESEENSPEEPVSAVKKPAKRHKKEKKAKKKHEEKVEKIPGKFIVKTNEGYYVKDNQYSVYKHEAHIFDDFNEAHKIKNLYGGKVVKL